MKHLNKETVWPLGRKTTDDSVCLFCWEERDKNLGYERQNNDSNWKKILPDKLKFP